VAYFSYPFNFELLHKKNPLNEKEIGKSLSLPVAHLHAIGGG